MRWILVCLLTLMAAAEPRNTWQVLTDPATPREVRMSYAREAPLDFSLASRLLAARTALRAEENLHHWGFSSYPFDARAFFPNPGLGGTTRKVLGHDWRVPQGPQRLEKDEQAPWPFYVNKALDVYLGRMAPHDADAAEKWLRVCLKLPRRTDAESLAFVEACQMSSHWKSVEVIEIWRKLALDPRRPETSLRVASTLADACRLWNDTRSMPLARQITLELLRSAPTEATRQQAAYGLRSLREQWDLNLGRGVRQPEPRECILEAVRLSQDPKCGDAWTRLYCYGFSACEGMDHPPFAVDRRMDPQSPLVAKQLHEVGIWLKAQRE